MEDPIFFAGGLSTDTDPQYQPAGTYIDAANLILTAGGHLTQERAASIIASSNLPILGATSLNGEEILFSSDGTTSEIGVSKGERYTTILRSSSFSLSYPVRATAKIDYRGHRLVYWGDGKSWCWLDLDNPPTVLPGGLAVLPTPSTPTISLASVQGGGNLPTGVYQATASLVTGSKNEAGYGLFTDIIPILDEDPTTSSRESLDGAPPQTAASGSITFTLDNLDTSYSYVRIVVATYVGITNQLTLHKLPLIPLNGKASVIYTYYSEEQHEADTTLPEVIGELPNYVSASEVTQKDGHLLAAGLTTAEPLDVDWQGIANKILLGPAIKEVPFKEDVKITRYIEGTTTGGRDEGTPTFTFDDYKKPELTQHKSLQRGEVYSFCFVPIVDGRRLNAYHIPGDNTGTSGTFQSYYSLEQYPLNQGYPPNAVRHHRMPSTQESPILVNGNIRILGFQELAKPDFSTLSAATQERITGYLIGMQARTPANKSILAQGILNPLQAAVNSYAYFVSPFAGQAGYGGGNNDANSRNRLSEEYAAFYSPETSITQDSIAAATDLQQVGILNGVSYGVADHRTGGLGDEYAAVFLDYKTIAPAVSALISLSKPVTTYIAGQDGTSPPLLQTGERYPIMTSGQNGFALLKSSTTNGIAKQNTPDLIYRFEGGNATSSLLFRQANNSYPNGDDANWKGVTTRPLFNLVATRTRQYGTLEQATYFPVAISNTSTPLTVFNGDTFIGKVALISATQELTDEDSGMGFITLSYFFCESTVNVNYRHYLAAVGETQGTIPYYPKSKNLWQKDGSGVMQYPTRLGQAAGYNKQYSFLNNLLPLSPRDYTVTPVNSFPNRIVYSAQGVEGEQLDAFRSFRVNDYHDIPKDKGPITSLAQVANKLFVHTTDCLYQSSFNERVTQESSLGEVVLGNGGLFPRPSEPLFTIDGGYAGSQSPYAAVTTPSGHFFVDEPRGKVFLLTSGLQELTKDGLTNSLRNSIQKGTRFIASYDYEQERYVLSGNSFFTISWSARNQKWVSYHNVSPTFTYSTPIRQLSQVGTTLSVTGKGPALAAAITLISNPKPDASKVFGNSEVHSTIPPSALSTYTGTQQSGEYKLVPYTAYGQEASEYEILTTQVNDELQLKLPRDRDGGRLRGKWLAHTWTFKGGGVPAILKQVTTLLTGRSR